MAMAGWSPRYARAAQPDAGRVLEGRSASWRDAAAANLHDDIVPSALSHRSRTQEHSPRPASFLAWYVSCNSARAWRAGLGWPCPRDHVRERMARTDALRPRSLLQLRCRIDVMR